VEVNLSNRDLTNLPAWPSFPGARCLPGWADIGRGACLPRNHPATLALLRPVERALCPAASLINRVRGRASCSTEGRRWLERENGISGAGGDALAR